MSPVSGETLMAPAGSRAFYSAPIELAGNGVLESRPPPAQEHLGQMSTTSTTAITSGAASALSAAKSSAEIQIVVFELGSERYGLDIASVYEIIRHQPITAVPQAPTYVKGVINLRGRIIPVVDLRDRFEMAQGELTKASRIVVAEASGTRVGLVVDGVSEVLMVPTDAIEPTPDVAAGVDASYQKGIAKLGERLIILLELDGLFGADGAGYSSTAAA
jgi:purine-binding chemotaxis protein CheW